jgi:hypothetical protein
MIIDDIASAMVQRERNQERRGLRLVTDGQPEQDAADVMRDRLTADGVAVSDVSGIGETEMTDTAPEDP